MTDQVAEFDVAIIGAGISGSALALALDDSGIKVLLLDAGDFPSQAVGEAESVDDFEARVSALTLESRDLFQRLGVWHDIEKQQCQGFSHMHVWDGEGTAGVIDFSADEVGEDALGFIVPNRAITYALLHRLQMSSNIKLLDNSRISGLHKSLQGYRFSVGEREVECKLLVGADGANSFIRQQLDFRTREWDYQHQGIVCTVETEQSHQLTAWQCFHHEGPVALLPLPSRNGRHFSSVVWSQEIHEADQLMELSDDDFAEALALAVENRLGEIKAVSKRFAFPLRQRHAVNYIKRSVALIGDAAHTIHPLAGQGINLGLKDVAVLSEELIKAAKAGLYLGDEQLLSRYQRRRKADNLAMMATMEAFKRLFGQRSKWLGLIRNKGMQVLNGVVPLKQQIIRHAIGQR